ncbi:6880_t:CDS:1, partial [Paraglomus occultum]
RFFSNSLPHGTKANKMNLAMFGQMLKMAPTTNNNKTLLDLVENDIGETGYHKVVAMVGRSGAEKTATVVDLAKQHFVVYCVCSDPGSIAMADFADQNFVLLAKDVEVMASNLQKPDSVQALKDNDTCLKQLAGERVEVEFLARLLFLQLLFKMKPELTPEQFFREQMNGGVTTIGKLVRTLRQYDQTTIGDMLFHVQDNLTKHIYSQERGLVIVLDEAHVAAKRILAGKLLTPSILSPSESPEKQLEVLLSILNCKNELQEEYRRGFLTPLCATLSNMCATLVVLGTSLSLADADHVYTAVGKKTNFEKITNFPSLDEQDVDNLLKNAIDLSDCEIPPAKQQKLIIIGRPRFSASVIGQLNDSNMQPKQHVFNCAVDSAINQNKKDLKIMVRSLLTNKAFNTAHLLGRMVLAYKLHNGKISFAQTSNADFVNHALCSLSEDSDDMHLIMNEPLVIDAVEEELKRSNLDPEFLEYLDQFNQVVENLGPETPVKGNVLEPLIRRCLQRFNGFDLVNLPFLQGVTLPTWCNGLKLQIEAVNTANGFGYNGQGVEADLEFLKDHPANKMLIEHPGTRQDGVWFFPNNQYAGSIGIKLYSDLLKEATHRENETSTDILSSFLKKDGVSQNPSLQRIRQDFEASPIFSELKGILRIHFEFPGVKGLKPKTCVKKNPKNPSIEDVI